ncbi:hypothetical protein [Actinoplanes sp. GCM10030250]|uniref:hypothetical protein n=1 Tax=Actinoplanes sp. GCM10030250 TaxID=3273376 RepID=UPI0036233B91
MIHGRVWTAGAHRVLHDDGTSLVLATWPGTIGLAPTRWIEWFTTGDDTQRPQAVADLADGRWQLGRWTWRDTAVLTWVGLDPYFNLQLYLPVNGGTPFWKINFERPVTRTSAGIDTFDLLLDYVTDPATGHWRWKDEDEYAQARQLGVITDPERRQVDAARERAVAFAEAGRGPLGEDWDTWHVAGDWPLPVLPADVLALGAGPSTGEPR